MSRPARILIIALVAGSPMSACAATRYDASIPSEPPPATTTTLPSGTAATLLPRLVSTSATLSNAITGDGDKTAIAEQIGSLWQAAKQDVGRTRPELLGDFEASVALAARAARFNRAADADKAYNNLRSLVAAYLG